MTDTHPNIAGHFLMSFFASALLVVGGMHMARGEPIFLFDLACGSIFFAVLTLPVRGYAP